MTRTIHCIKLGKELPGLEQPPFPGALGQRIYEHVSAEGYELWKPHLTTIINHYGLNPADPETRAMLRNEMESFFFGEGAMQAQELTPDTVRQAD
jgi:Fe-S cluster biosynthesis and repair protein YggX